MAPRGGGWAELTWTAARVLLPAALDYRLARGLPAGVSHTFDLHADIELGTHFVLGVNGRARWHRPPGRRDREQDYVLSMHVKGYL